LPNTKNGAGKTSLINAIANDRGFEILNNDQENALPVIFKSQRFLNIRMVMRLFKND